ncbi:DUF488 domain-containing protein [Desulfobulbus sp. F1]|nr:DUF488 domain-containing protein [Desulfobulbus sp. F1]
MKSVVTKEIISARYPKYYRQRFVITLLQYSNRNLTRADFQKFLFESQQETEICYYDFVSSINGFHSFQADSDLEILHRLGWIEIKNNEIILLHKLPREKGLTQTEAQKLLLFMRGKKYCKEQFLFLDFNKPCEEKYSDKEPLLFTIGYEGVSFEEYVNKLLQKNVRLLCDVRMNPISRKFGFSKGNLSNLLPILGIEYLHIPEFGIMSSSRKHLHTASDYQCLFADYTKELRKKKKSLSILIEVMNKYKRIALTCFERQPLFCHRHCISEYLQEEEKITVIHL